MYGLKQAPRAWDEKMDLFFLFSSRFNQCYSDMIIYTKGLASDLLILVLYVDDSILIGIYSSMIQNIKEELMGNFSKIDISLLHYFLGLHVHQSSCSLKKLHIDHGGGIF